MNPQEPIDPEWEKISKVFFGRPTPKAPPFLWTRVLARIEELERCWSCR